MRMKRLWLAGRSFTRFYSLAGDQVVNSPYTVAPRALRDVVDSSR
jgi:hypothetical protein